jgi:hypothetical protein
MHKLMNKALVYIRNTREGSYRDTPPYPKKKKEAGSDKDVQMSQSQSCCTTSFLPPISSSLRQAPWGSRPEIFSPTENYHFIFNNKKSIAGQRFSKYIYMATHKVTLTLALISDNRKPRRFVLNFTVTKLHQKWSSLIPSCKCDLHSLKVDCIL